MTDNQHTSAQVDQHTRDRAIIQRLHERIAELEDEVLRLRAETGR
jgi:uncharacterized small protein (DUF1192 family)